MRKLTLNGRTVLVTGAARGLGRQLALGLGV
jgi:NAD(P)-dependent dehydrogenase (short-subunit alcohol dehydrogenase family)